MENCSKYNIRIINLSIGANDRYVNMPLVKAVDDAWDAGLVVIAAAGNAGLRSGVVTSPGISKKIITVGCCTSVSPQIKIDDSCGYYHRQLLCPDVYAPGNNIISCLSPMKNTEDIPIYEHSYIPMSGTSMATPMVSGAAALLLEKTPSLSPAQIKKILWTSATVITRENPKNGGLLNIQEMLDCVRPRFR